MLKKVKMNKLIIPTYHLHTIMSCNSRLLLKHNVNGLCVKVCIVRL